MCFYIILFILIFSIEIPIDFSLHNKNTFVYKTIIIKIQILPKLLNPI